MTVKGRSQAYVNKLVSVLESSGVEIRTSAPVSAVERTASGEADCTRPLCSFLWTIFQEFIMPPRIDIIILLKVDIFFGSSLSGVRCQRIPRYNDTLNHLDILIRRRIFCRVLQPSFSAHSIIRPQTIVHQHQPWSIPRET